MPRAQIQTFPLRRIPRLTETVTLEAPGEYYDGWRVTFRVNPPFSVLVAPEQRDLAQVPRWLAQLITDWDFVDEEGQPLPVSAEGVGRLPAALVRALLEAWQRVIEVPKPS